MFTRVNVLCGEVAGNESNLLAMRARAAKFRTNHVGRKVSAAEFTVLEEHARAAGLTLSEWVRDVLLSAPVEPSVELASELVPAELPSLRSLFLNLQFRAQGAALGSKSHSEQLRLDHLRLARPRRQDGYVRPNASSPESAQVYVNGKLLATIDAQQATHFHLTDWLGTRRLQASPTGSVELTFASRPFGDTDQPFSASAQDATTEHYTGKERDTESGLDYFGARY